MASLHRMDKKRGSLKPPLLVKNHDSFGARWMNEAKTASYENRSGMYIEYMSSGSTVTSRLQPFRRS